MRSNSFSQSSSVAAISSFVLAGVMLMLSILGLWHLSKVGETEEVLVTRKQSSLKPAMA